MKAFGRRHSRQQCFDHRCQGSGFKHVASTSGLRGGSWLAEAFSTSLRSVMEAEYSVDAVSAASHNVFSRQWPTPRSDNVFEAPASMPSCERSEKGKSMAWSMPKGGGTGTWRRSPRATEPQRCPPIKHEHECACCGISFINPLKDERTDALCGEFSMHGLPRAMRIDTSKLRRFLWLMIFLGGLAAFIALVVIQIQSYNDYNTMKTVNIVDASKQGGLYFPAVTIWNVNTVRKSAVVNTPYFDEVCGDAAGLEGDENEGFQRYPLNWTDEDIVTSAHQLERLVESALVA
eukprot:jgi/Chlat1/1068/Chrsp110S01567